MRTGVRKDYLKGSRRNGRGYSPYPFDRFLTSRLGLRWDDVYSELCSEFDNRSHAGRRFRDDLDWHVKTCCYIGVETGAVYHESDGWPGRVSNEFYVHPFTGLLCWADAVPREKTEKEIVHIDLQDGKSFQKSDGIWFFHNDYSIEHEGLTFLRPSYVRPKDVVLVDGVEQYRVKWTEHVHVKQQLSKKELRAHGLANAGRPYGKRCAVCGFDCVGSAKCVHAIKAEAEARGGRVWRF